MIHLLRYCDSIPWSSLRKKAKLSRRISVSSWKRLIGFMAALLADGGSIGIVREINGETSARLNSDALFSWWLRVLMLALIHTPRTWLKASFCRAQRRALQETFAAWCHFPFYEHFPAPFQLRLLKSKPGVRIHQHMVFLHCSQAIATALNFAICIHLHN